MRPSGKGGDRQTDEASGATAGKTPVAVALRYVAERDSAPKVVASGRGAVARQILEIAFANDVKVREDADLAELLSHVGVDSEIPLEAFAAVAEILAYVYRANGEAGPPMPAASEEARP